jgi:hypothetical protein
MFFREKYGELSKKTDRYKFEWSSRFEERHHYPMSQPTSFCEKHFIVFIVYGWHSN